MFAIFLSLIIPFVDISGEGEIFIANLDDASSARGQPRRRVHRRVEGIARPLSPYYGDWGVGEEYEEEMEEEDPWRASARIDGLPYQPDLDLIRQDDENARNRRRLHEFGPLEEEPVMRSIVDQRPEPLDIGYAPEELDKLLSKIPEAAEVFNNRDLVPEHARFGLPLLERNFDYSCYVCGRFCAESQLRECPTPRDKCHWNICIHCIKVLLMFPERSGVCFMCKCETSTEEWLAELNLNKLREIFPRCTVCLDMHPNLSCPGGTPICSGICADCVPTTIANGWNSCPGCRVKAHWA